MQVLIENAGAQHGLLLLPRDGQLTVMAARSTGGCAAQDSFSKALVSYVIRSGEPLVLEDAARDPRFADSFRSSAPPRSLLCAPLLEKGKLVAVLYLENNLTDGAFSPERLELVKLLGAQAALSLNNAMLYATLEQKVEQRTRELVAKNEELRQTQRQLVTQEKLAALGTLTAGIAHELKNPLNFVNNFAESAKLLNAELRECLGAADIDANPETEEEIEDILANLDQVVGKIREHGQRADKIINSMLLHSRSTSSEHEVIQLNDLVESSFNLAYHGACAQDANLALAIEKNYAQKLDKISASRTDLSRVLLNLIGNAIYSLRQKQQKLGPSYKPTIRLETYDAGSHAEIRVRDNGVGIPTEIVEKLFSPFFTTKPPGEGTGLGLSISHDIIVNGHQGQIKVETLPNEYAEFIVRLPKDKEIQSILRGAIP
jgi:signal transduction histidine kinase